MPQNLNGGCHNCHKIPPKPPHPKQKKVPGTFFPVGTWLVGFLSLSSRKNTMFFPRVDLRGRFSRSFCDSAYGESVSLG